MITHFSAREFLYETTEKLEAGQTQKLPTLSAIIEKINESEDEKKDENEDSEIEDDDPVLEAHLLSLLTQKTANSHCIQAPFGTSFCENGVLGTDSLIYICVC